MPTKPMMREAFPGCEDRPLAITLLRLLSRGAPVTTEALANALDRRTEHVARTIAGWPNVERDAADAIVGFSGLTLRPTNHVFEVNGQEMYTWCAWDALFLPPILRTSARVRSTCPVTSEPVRLVVTPDGIADAAPKAVSVSFPAPTGTDATRIQSSFCCHVHFLAGPDAVRKWTGSHPGSEVVSLQAAFELGCDAVGSLLSEHPGDLASPRVRVPSPSPTGTKRRVRP